MLSNTRFALFPFLFRCVFQNTMGWNHMEISIDSRTDLIALNVLNLIEERFQDGNKSLRFATAFEFLPRFNGKL